MIKHNTTGIDDEIINAVIHNALIALMTRYGGHFEITEEEFDSADEKEVLMESFDGKVSFRLIPK